MRMCLSLKPDNILTANKKLLLKKFLLSKFEIINNAPKAKRWVKKNGKWEEIPDGESVFNLEQPPNT
jgi:hypothetical protein